MAVIVVGSINTDLVVRGPRLPRPGETVLGGVFYRAAGGKGANQAVAAARASQQSVTLVAAVGDDAFGSDALDGLRRERLDCRHVRTVAGEASGIALILVDEQGQNCISVASGANEQLTASAVEHLPGDLFASAGVLLVCLEIPLETVAAALQRARSAGLTTVLNPAPASREVLDGGLLSHVDVLTPNEHEATLLSGIAVRDVDAAILAGRKLRERGCRSVIVTLGERGCVVIEDEATIVEALTVEAVDATAAGDAFSGVLAAALADGLSLIAAARRATVAAGLTVTGRGAQPSLPTAEEIELSSPKDGEQSNR